MITTSVHILEVRRTYIPMNIMSTQWLLEPYTCTVWVHNGIFAKVPSNKVPPEYEPGLLTCYIDDRQVSLQDFDDALRLIDTTRADIELILKESGR